MFACKMYWGGKVDCNGYNEFRSGIKIFFAGDKEDAMKQVDKFFNHGSFVDWNALVESEDFVFERTIED